ncbi:GPSM2 [Branchiostoma lanceolatum]|uniref:GPSM2 protein n=1 Tax=Branchiostoma lanceolatum TaxID=7740 RepID=A0A8K0EI72_BRALA|nr:GPSM2 [Branchiostoma lanceolatum]
MRGTQSDDVMVTVGKNEAAFTKSAGLYRAALDRCEDSDGSETLKHRIEYGEEVKKHEAKKAKKLLERQTTGETLVPDNKWLTSPSNLTNETSDVISAGNYGGVFKQHFQDGSRALQTGDLDSAERNFAAALKSVHVKGEHWKEVEPLCKLTDVYMARGMQSKDGGDFTKAAALCNAALERSKAANGDEPVSLFDSSSKLQAEVYKSLCDNRKWKTYTERALQEERSTHGKNAVHPDIADLLNKLGQAWKNLGDHRKTIKCYKEALQMARTMYGTVHPDIDASLNNLGNAWTDLGVHDIAVRHYEQALQMERSMYGESTAHPDIATSLINLGSAWSELGGYKKAYNYYEQALKMTRTIYGENKAHPDIAAALNNLGNVWQNLGDNRKAISYHEQSLQMSRSIYGETTAHSEIASSLDNLGNVLRDLGDFRDAASYYEQALLMKKSVYGDSTSHPLIADSLHSIGNTWFDLGGYGKALNYYEQSLQMRRSIYVYVYVIHPATGSHVTPAETKTLSGRFGRVDKDLAAGVYKLVHVGFRKFVRIPVDKDEAFRQDGS